MVDIIIYRRCKTKKDYRIQINKDLRGEIEWFENNYPSTNEYLLPIIIDERQGAAMTAYINSKRKKYSQRLKELAKVLEFPEALGDISTYYSRHSYAMALRGKGANVDVIQQAMGHSNSTTTQIYLEGFDEGFMAKMSEDLI